MTQEMFATQVAPAVCTYHWESFMKVHNYWFNRDRISFLAEVKFTYCLFDHSNQLTQGQNERALYLVAQQNLLAQGLAFRFINGLLLTFKTAVQCD